MGAMQAIEYKEALTKMDLDSLKSHYYQIVGLDLSRRASKLVETEPHSDDILQQKYCLQIIHQKDPSFIPSVQVCKEHTL